MRLRLLRTALSLGLLCVAGLASPWRSAPATTPQVIEVALREFEIVPKDMAAKPGEVLFVVRNVGVIEHDFVIQDAAGKTVAAIAVIGPGKTEELRVVLRPGRYPVLCSFAGHKEAGMTATLTVKGP